MTQDELKDAALTLENDGLFYREYTREHLANGQGAQSMTRRECIHQHLLRLRIQTSREDREALRLYLDSKDAK